MRLDDLSKPPPDTSFDKPVMIELVPGKPKKIRNARDAMDALDEFRPSATEPGKKHMMARRACMNALLGLRQAAMARKAFEEAAWESDVLVDDE
jgi:hypothetical protein